MNTSLYPSSTSISSLLADSNTSLWPVSGSGKEVDLRKEFQEFLYGSDTEVAKGRLGIIRKMRKDDDGDLIPCACVDDITDEPDLDTECVYCQGEGWLWDEEWIVYYKTLVSSHEGLVRKNQPYKPGISNIPFVFFYVEYSVEPEKHDRIIEVARDVAGDVVTPLEREARYSIATCEDFRSDNGRVEYWRLSVTEDAVRSNWQG